jgi:hypothetical protein
MRKLTVGIACVIIGIMMMAYTGYDMLANDKIVNAGSIEITKEKSHFIQWSPVVGLGLFVGGIMVFVRAKRSLNKS